MSDSKRVTVFVVLSAVCIVVFMLCFMGKKSDEINTNSADNADSSETASSIYDTTAISSAYLSGDTSKLSEFDMQIYNKASEILELIISDDMSAYEKELAVHDYLVYNVSYDDSQLNVFYKHDKNSVNPYGALINGKAICSGYTSSFRMFMDMLEIPCLTVEAKDEDGGDHAWNMVELDGDWYYVDVTWDDPMPESENSPMHEYFNVTEDFLREHGHVWNSEELPKADADKYSYENQ